MSFQDESTDLSTELDTGTSSTELGTIDSTELSMGVQSPQEKESVMSSEIEPVSELADYPEESLSKEPPETNVVQAKKFWDARTKKYFNSLSKEGRELWLKSFNKAEYSYNKNLDLMKKTYGHLDEIANTLAPYADKIAAINLSIPDYIEALIKADEMATTEPYAYILGLMENKGITLELLRKSIPSYRQYQQFNKYVAPVKQELQQLKNTTASTAYQQEVDAQAAAIKRFFAQKDPSGRLKYPYFEELAPTMMKLVDPNDNDPDLDQLYKMAYGSVMAAKGKMPASKRPLDNFAINKSGVDDTFEDYSFPEDSGDTKYERFKSLFAQAGARRGIRTEE
jgi:hypothetical protein